MIYHKYECPALSGHAYLRAQGKLDGPLHHTTRLLYRILVMKKHQLLSDLQWKALTLLESHFPKHMQSSFGTFICDNSKLGKILTGTELDLPAIQHLVCMVCLFRSKFTCYKSLTQGDLADDKFGHAADCGEQHLGVIIRHFYIVVQSFL